MSLTHPLHVVILAAGRGKRMQTRRPKVLHHLAGKPMLKHISQTAMTLGADAVHVVVGHEAELIKKSSSDLPVNWVVQEQQLGTGHAVLQAMPHIADDARVLILSGDVPLTQLETLQALSVVDASMVLLVAKLPNPFGFGRIVRNAQGDISAIVEEKDASAEQKNIHEIYTGICSVRAKDLKRWLPMLSTNNASGEYYLTKIIEFAVQEGQRIASIEPNHLFEVQGVNTLVQLNQLERDWQQHLATQLMDAGVQIADVQRLDIRGQLESASDVFIDVNVIFEGHVQIGQHSSIGPNCVIKDAIIGKNVKIKAHSVIENAVIGDDCEVGPFARLRPGTQLAAHCKIGNFVETKNAQIGEHSKASHLSYLGDVSIGKHVNIGCGTITCNYDGVNKHQTIIHDHVFIGSDTQLVAPVEVGEGATIGAGTTVREDAPAHALTLTPNRQKSILGWKLKPKAKVKA
jgi:bifunctional UDP-N-acetylglucosamine pyrophosphorylase/glucosamine-1-phosphate N-acetyltransferase